MTRRSSRRCSWRSHPSRCCGRRRRPSSRRRRWRASRRCLCARMLLRSRSTVALAGAAVATAYAVQFRPESFLIVPVVGLLLWRASARRAQAAATLVGGVAVPGARRRPCRSHVRGPERGVGHNRSAAVARICASTTSRQRAGSTSQTSASRRSSRCSRSSGCLGGRSRPNALSMVLYFLLFFGIYLLFYAGSYNYGADVRYSLMTYPPLAVLGGAGCGAVGRWLERARMPAAGATCADGGPRVPVSLVSAARSRDDRGSVGGARGRAVCASRSRPSFRRTPTC